jgi:NDP-sugar pyrophosphorylase family protein
MTATFRAPAAVILAGGLGTRLRPAVADRPKALADILGRPFLAWQLDGLARQGIKRVAVCVHYLSAMIEERFPEGLLRNGILLTYSREEQLLGTAGALRLALNAVPGEDPLLVLNGDTFCPFNLRAFLHAHQSNRAAITLLAAHVPDTSRYGAVEIDESMRVKAFHEKRPASNTPGWISAGTYLISRCILEALPANRAYSIENDLFPHMIDDNMYAHRGETNFIDIGTPEGYSASEQYIRINRRFFESE